MAHAPRLLDSDDAAFGAPPSDDVDASCSSDDHHVDWDADPAAILEAREQEAGVNCFDQPIH